MLGDVAVSFSSSTPHCLAVPTTEAEHMALEEGAKQDLHVKGVLSFLKLIL